MTNSNPIKCIKPYTGDFKFETDYGKENYVKKPEKGHTYLKVTMICSSRCKHEKDCILYSYYNFGNERGCEIETEKSISFYIKVPAHLYNLDGSLKTEELDNDMNLINDNNNEKYFDDWTHSYTYSCAEQNMCTIIEKYYPAELKYVIFS
jgi:hypothetical protein